MGMQPLPEGGLHRSLPAGFDLEIFPELRRARQPVPVEPLDQLAVLGHRVLDLPQRG